MSSRLLLAEPQASTDLDTFLGRAVQVEDGSARVVATGGVLAVYVPVLFPSGLLDDSATILGLRTFALADAEAEAATRPQANERIALHLGMTSRAQSRRPPRRPERIRK